MKIDIINSLVKILSLTTLLSMGMEASIENLKAEFRNSNFVVVLSWSVLIFPLIVLGMGSLVVEDKNLLLGLFISAASAGGSSAGIFVKYVKGREVVSGSLVILQSAISLFLVPFYLYLMTQTAISTFMDTINSLLFAVIIYQLLPFILGIYLKIIHFNYRYFVKIIDRFNKIVLVILILGFLIRHFHLLMSTSFLVLFFVAGINFFVFSHWIYNFIVDYELTTTLVPTVGIRNLTSALFISSVINSDSKLQFGILLYGFFMYVTAIIWIFMIRTTKTK